MRWIQRNKDKISRGEVAPPDAGDLFFVDEKGSHAIVNGQYYKDGQPATQGKHQIAFKNGETLDIDVDSAGKATRQKGGGGSGKSGNKV